LSRRQGEDQRSSAQIVSGIVADDFENRYVRKNGTLVDVMWSAYWSEADKIMFCVAHDITERTRVTRALKRAEQEANRANAAKSEFLSRMSHELRTPMNAILGFAQLLEFDDLTADQRDGVAHILRGGRHLLELINEVLDISRIEAGELSLSTEPVEVTSALQETLDLVQPLAAARNVRLISLPCTSRYVMADRQRLKQVLINLVSNAIKYNRLEGSVTITCEASENHARIAITDTGIGIPAERIEQLFTPFQRLGAEHSAIEGTGLGLTVAKRLVEAMAGTIGVESTPGQGTTFWVEFLLTDSALAIAELPHEDAAPEVLPHERTQKVLYIEDNLSNLRLIERLLERRPASSFSLRMKASPASVWRSSTGPSSSSSM
jgi:signal transduction histidine kinase